MSNTRFKEREPECLGCGRGVWVPHPNPEPDERGAFGPAILSGTDGAAPSIARSGVPRRDSGTADVSVGVGVVARPEQPLVSRSARIYGPKADMAGALASGACAVHCALMPFAAGLLPAAAARVFGSEFVHNLFALVVLATSFLAFLPGWLRHGESRIWGWATSGLALIFIARISGAESMGIGGEALCATAGGLLLLVAHRLNHSLAYWCDRS